MEPHELIFAVTNAGVAARCLHVVADLGVADHIDDRPVPAEELARRCAVDPDGLNRVLRLLAAHGVFSLADDGYQHSPASRLLRSDHPMSMRAFPQMMGLPVVLRSFDELAHSVRTGRPSIELSDPDGLWGYLSGAPTERAVFGQAMTARAAGDTAGVLAAYDFSSSRRIVDVGGGRGHLLHAVLEATPRARGILVDLPGVVEAGGPAHPRLVRQAGDFLVDPLPAADTYLVMDVIHDWADTEALTILTAVRRAATDDARVPYHRGDPAREPRPWQPDDRRHHAGRHRRPGANWRRVGPTPRCGWSPARTGHRHPGASPDRRGLSVGAVTCLSGPSMPAVR